MKNVALFLLFTLLITSCVKEVPWSSPGPTPSIIVVDATLTDEAKIQRVSIMHPVSELNAQPSPVANADVLVSTEDSTWSFKESENNPGAYLSPPGFIALQGKNYTLFISTGGKIYTAKAQMVGGKTFKELQYVKNSEDDFFHIDWVASAFAAEDAAMWEVLLDWSKVEGYETADSLSTHARLLFYTLPTLDVSEIFAPEMETVVFPAGTIITENRYSLTPEHAEFARELLLETNWTGGFFNVASSSVTTNLSSGAKGYFGICSVTTLSLTVTP
jgi:hypothetical protein